jgi:four helix bundle protein
MENKNKTTNALEIEDRLIEFASRIMDLVDALPKSPAGKIIGNQLLRSGTSPALNYGEARSAESRDDFIHKMKVCLKELRETHVCLKIIVKRNWFQAQRITPLLEECNELVAMFVASTKTAAGKSPNPPS